MGSEITHSLLSVDVPEEIAEYVPGLQYFVQNMVQKLHVNRHKGFCKDETIKGLIKKLTAEQNELQEALGESDQFQAYMESVDVANFAWLIGLMTLRMTKAEYKESQQADHLDE